MAYIGCGFACTRQQLEANNNVALELSPGSDGQITKKADERRLDDAVQITILQKQQGFPPPMHSDAQNQGNLFVMQRTPKLSTAAAT
jgi:hypothetical protein